MRHRVVVPLDRVAQRQQRIARGQRRGRCRSSGRRGRGPGRSARRHWRQSARRRCWPPAAGSPTGPPVRPAARGGAARSAASSRSLAKSPSARCAQAGMPRSTSRAISASICACDSRSPASSSRRASGVPAMSYQARMTKPPFIVTGRIGACGKMKRAPPTAARSSSCAMGTKSLPSAPRPCSTIRLAPGSSALCISMVSSVIGRLARAPVERRPAGALRACCACSAKRCRQTASATRPARPPRP